jgi:hypothetical protein|tara:strand:+ start:63 stop:254 length:192 start_codon:yes stop_codon:yes gene_type:complete
MSFLDKSNKVSNIFYAGTIMSVIGSVLIWNSDAGTDPAHIQRLALFVGLWAPTFMGFSNYYKE